MWAMALVLGLGQSKPAEEDLTRYRAETVVVLNAFRQRLGLEAALPDDRLDDAATAHGLYLDGTGKVSHGESPDVAGFLGATPRDRARLKGFVRPLGEVVTALEGRGSEAYQSGLVRLLLQPYHRMPLFTPGPLVVGTGPAKDFLVIDYAPGKAKQLPASPVVFPVDGQTGVPPKVVVNELPDPLRIHPGTPKLVGMPITVQYFGLKTFAFIGARLTTRKNQETNILVNHPGNDPEVGPSAVVVIPAEPLQSKTEYRLELVAKTGDQSQTVLRTTFTTGSPEDAWTVFVLGVKGPYRVQ